MGIGTVINVVTVLVDGGAGTLTGAWLPRRMRETAMQAIGLVTLLICVSNFLISARAPTARMTLTVVAVK